MGRLPIFLGPIVFAATAALPAQAVSPRQLVELVDIGNPAISPSGHLVAYRTEQASVERNTYDTYWYVQALDPPSAPRRVAHGGLPIREHATGLVAPAPPTWSPDERWIYYLAILGGKIAVWRAASDGSGAEPVTNDAADVRQFRLSGDGQRLFYSVGATREEVRSAERREYDRGIHIDGTVRVGAGLFRSSRFAGRPATQRIWGQWFESGSLLATIPDQWKVVDLRKMSTSTAGAPEEPAGTEDSLIEAPEIRTVPDPSGTRVAVLRNTNDTDPGVKLSIRYGQGKGPETPCRAKACSGRNITDVSWIPGKEELLFTVVDRAVGRAHSIYKWTPTTERVDLVLHVSGTARGSSQRFFDVPCAVSSKAVVCVTAEADRPPRLELVEFETDRRRVLFEPNAGLARDIERMGGARLVRWTDSRGRDFSGWMFTARNGREAGSAPLFVTLYTCDGFMRGGLGDEWPLIPLALAGISSICINGNPEPFVMETYYGQAVHAIEGLVAMLAGENKTEPAKIGMGGLSHGSEMTMWTASDSCLLTAASVASPSVTPNWYLFNSLREGFRHIVDSHWGLGDPRDSPERWKEVSPVFKLDSINVPVLFQLPEEEWLMASEYAIPLVRQGKAEIFVFPDEPHIKFQPRHKLHAYERNLDWFRFWLLDEEDELVDKVDQYRRWRDMKMALVQDVDKSC